MNLMKDPVFAQVVGCLFNDQGMDIPENCCVDLTDLPIDRARRYLATLNAEQLEAFCIGDREEEVGPMVQAGGPDAEAAHEVVDELFMIMVADHGDWAIPQK
jgi:hypothetical protein